MMSAAPLSILPVPRNGRGFSINMVAMLTGRWFNSEIYFEYQLE
jgi:hypothetical protein